MKLSLFTYALGYKSKCILMEWSLVYEFKDVHSRKTEKDIYLSRCCPRKKLQRSLTPETPAGRAGDLGKVEYELISTVNHLAEVPPPPRDSVSVFYLAKCT